MRKVVVIHGPNLNMLGQREPEIYGSETLEQLNAAIEAEAEPLGLTVACHQSNSEAKIIELLQGYRQGIAGVIINPGGYSHTSVAILDALLALEVPAVEVHLSNIFCREEFRQNSITASGVIGVISGLGKYSYLLALRFLAELGDE